MATNSEVSGFADAESHPSPHYNQLWQRRSFGFDVLPYQPMSVTLLDEDGLWTQFNKLTTEMIISKTGRNMFPNVKVKMENLSHLLNYTVFLEFRPVDVLRYRYDRDTWSTKMTENGPAPEWLQHPRSPSLGCNWMEKPVEFSVKLTNCSDTGADGMVCLHSMHKYSLHVHVIQSNDTSERDPQLTRSFPLLTTTFMAVTTYQNQAVKNLKTSKNPHAKGVYKRKLSLWRTLDDIKENLEVSPKKPRFDVNPACLPARNEIASTSNLRVCCAEASISQSHPFLSENTTYSQLELVSENTTYSQLELAKSNYTSTAQAINNYTTPNDDRIAPLNSVTAHWPDVTRMPHSTPLTVHCHHNHSPFSPAFQGCTFHHTFHQPHNLLPHNYSLSRDNFYSPNFTYTANDFDPHALSVNFDPHALSVNFDPHALSVNFNPHALSVSNFNPHALSVSNFNPHALSVSNFNPHALSVNNFNPHALSVNNCETQVLSGCSSYRVGVPDHSSTSSNSSGTDRLPSSSTPDTEYSLSFDAETGASALPDTSESESTRFIMESSISSTSSNEELQKRASSTDYRMHLHSSSS